jgi:hypothetical protein
MARIDAGIDDAQRAGARNAIIARRSNPFFARHLPPRAAIL